MCNMLVQVRPGDRKNTGFYAGWEPACPGWEARYPETPEKCYGGRAVSRWDARGRYKELRSIRNCIWTVQHGQRPQGARRIQVLRTSRRAIGAPVLGSWVWESLVLVGWLLVGWLSVVGWLVVG